MQYYDAVGQLGRIAAGTVDLGYLRFGEDEDPVDKDTFHRVLLYREPPVVCAAAEHWIAAAEESVTVEELTGETFVDPAEMISAEVSADIHTPRSGAELGRAERLAVEVAASGAGVVVLPESVARMLSRKDLVIRSLEGASDYHTGLGWLRDRDQELIQEFIGIARGRTAGSHRSQLTSGGAKPEAAPAGNARQPRRPQPRSRRARPPRGRRRPR